MVNKADQNPKSGYFAEIAQTFVLPHTHTTILRPLFPGPPGWAGARRELLDFMVQGEINIGRHTDHPAGRHSIRTNHMPTSTIPPYFLRVGCPSCHPTNSVKALKARPACYWSKYQLTGLCCIDIVWVCVLWCSRFYLQV